MKPICIALLITLSAAAHVGSQETTPTRFDVRRARWGMSRAEVKSSENPRPTRDDDQGILYSDTMSGYDSIIEYRFEAGSLSSLVCSLKIQHSNQNDYMTDFKNLKATLSLEFGAPLKEQAIWKNKIFKDEAEDWVDAVAAGHLEYEATWETETTRIALVMKGGDRPIGLDVIYSEARSAAP